MSIYCIIFYFAGTMTSSSSCSSNIQIRSDLIDDDVLWMQPKHVSEHVWNEEQDKKLHIRRAVLTYEGEEQIPEEIITLIGKFSLRLYEGIRINETSHTLYRQNKRPLLKIQNVIVALLFGSSIKNQ